ncbi:hypothetical protein [Kibdelosporangium philippinense]|uniref:hypothetical protein n=1 Tax=Kibdelosporangium philippinense TaxID=211113 RepID=UPI0036237A00
MPTTSAKADHPPDQPSQAPRAPNPRHDQASRSIGNTALNGLLQGIQKFRSTRVPRPKAFQQRMRGFRMDETQARNVQIDRNSGSSASNVPRGPGNVRPSTNGTEGR